MSKVPGFGPAAAAAGRAGPGDVASDPGRRRASRCGARLCVSVGRRPAGSARLGRVRECARGCESRPLARRGGKGIPHASGAEPGRPPSAAGSARRAPAPRPVLPRAEEGPEHWRPSELLSLSTLPPQKMGDQVQSRKKGPLGFFKEKTKPKRVPILLASAPDPLASPSQSSFPAGRQINK